MSNYPGEENKGNFSGVQQHCAFAAAALSSSTKHKLAEDTNTNAQRAAASAPKKPRPAPTVIAAASPITIIIPDTGPIGCTLRSNDGGARVFVEKVKENSLAQRAGVQVGDVPVDPMGGAIAYDDFKNMCVGAARPLIFRVRRTSQSQQQQLAPAPVSAPPAAKSATATAATVQSAKRVPPKESVATRKFGRIAGKGRLPDASYFSSYPCRLEGGERHPVSCYGREGDKSKLNTYWFYMQRASDRNYAMRSFCLENGNANYSSFKHKLFTYPIVNWHTATNLKQHCCDESIIDTHHLDLIAPNPIDNKSLLTEESLLSACNSSAAIECLFLNLYQGSEESLIQAIRSNFSTLKCLSLVSCNLSRAVMDTVADCALLRGLILSDNENKAEGEKAVDDLSMARILRRCNHLKWLHVDQHNGDGPPFFGTECWTALGEEEMSCPDLEMLWVKSVTSTDDRYGIALGNHDVIRSALTDPYRSQKIKVCMINMDTKGKTRFVINAKRGAKNADRLDGDEYPQMPSYW